MTFTRRRCSRRDATTARISTGRLADLSDLYPAVADLTVVPVGLTRWHNPCLRPYTDAEAADVLAQTLTWQARLRETLGVGFVYPSDEWFLRAGVPVPPLEAYDGLLPALVENGVGMVRLFLDRMGGAPGRIWRSLAVRVRCG